MGKHHLYMTNIPPELLEAEDIARTYAARWEVELMFKELKSHLRLHDIPSQKRRIVKNPVYATVLSLIVSRALLFKLRKHCGVSIARTPERRWTRISQNAATAVLELLTSQRQLFRRWIDLEKLLAHEFLDTSINRL